MIGLGVVTHDRPEAAAICLDSVHQHLLSAVDMVLVQDDGSSDEYRLAYKVLAYRTPWASWSFGSENRGVGYAKNRLLLRMLAAGCDWLFLAEDDMCFDDQRAIGGYIEACEESGHEHLSFAHHGHHNVKPRSVVGPVTIWPNCVGAYCIYSRRSLLAAGLLDEEFYNAWEHVEHTQRLAFWGYTTSHYAQGTADATDSPSWLHAQEVRNSWERPEGWDRQVADMKAAWAVRRPETYRLAFP